MRLLVYDMEGKIFLKIVDAIMHIEKPNLASETTNIPHDQYRANLDQNRI